MKCSIRSQVMAVMIGMVMFVLVLVLAINGGFLGNYYTSLKENSFEEVYHMLSDECKETDFDKNGPSQKMSQYCEMNNISMLVTNKNYDVIYSNERSADIMLYRLQGYLFDKNSQVVLKEADRYMIVKSKDPRTNTEYIDMWGQMENGEIFILQSPIESIRETVKVFNRFIAVVGVIVLVVAILLSWYFSKRLTEPLKELADLSQKMAELDFEAKYKSGGTNEIGVLGQSFNQMSEKLEQTISDLKTANNELQKDIEQKEQLENMRSEFLGNVSHELKTPIALIQGYAEGLKEGVNDDPESREFYCEVIMDEAGKMNRMVRNLLTLNQLEFGKEEIQFERFDIIDLIRGILQSMEIMISQKEATMIFREEHPVYVWADEYKVEQVMRNYISNALNHVDFEKIIEIKIKTDDQHARISVFNTGKAIPEEDLNHIWDKFYKVDKARTREYGGNGIGLSIVKAIMDSFHQKYGVANYDNGVEFWFELDQK